MDYPHSSSIETAELIIKEVIDNYSDFDTAILGCGAYGPPLQNMLYNKFGPTKNIIYLASNIYTLFGIKTNGIAANDHDANIEYALNASEKMNSKYRSIDQGRYWNG